MVNAMNGYRLVNFMWLLREIYKRLVTSYLSICIRLRVQSSPKPFPDKGDKQTQIYDPILFVQVAPSPHMFVPEHSLMSKEETSQMLNITSFQPSFKNIT